MNLRFGLGTVALSVTFAGTCVGQAPAQEPAAEVLTIRTSGQPERKVTVLRTERLPDGTILADVRDTVTGITYTLTNPSGLKSETVAPRIAMPVPAMLASARTSAPQTPISTTPVASRPIQSSTRPVFDPTGGPSPSTKLVTFTDMPSAQKPNPNARRQSAFPTNETLVPVDSVAGNPATQYLPQTRPRYVDPQLGKNATNVPTSSANYQTTSAYGNALTPAKQPPSVLGKLFGANDSKPKAQARVGVLPPPSIITNAGTPVARRPVAELPSAEAPPVASVITPVATTEPIAAIVPEVSEELELTDKQLAAMINEMVKNIQSHPRPSFRMTNASNLAECKAAAQQDVKELLAFAAENDAIGVVRGHCIGLLSKMGHAEANYVKNLEAWTTDSEPAVQSAAIAALAKLR